MDTEAENMAASTPDAEGGRLERTRAPREVDAPLLTWLWRSYLKPQRMWLGVAFIFMVIEGSMLGALSYIIQPMFDQVFIGGDSSAVYIVAGIVGGIFLLRAISAFTHRILIQGAGLRIITSMQKDMVAHLLTLDSAYFRTNPPGSLIERVRGDTAAANMIWGSILATAGRDVTSLVVLLGVAISVDPLWTLVAVAGVPLLLGPVVALQKFVRKTTLRARDAAGRLTLRLDEIFHGVDTIKLNTSESREHARAGRYHEATQTLRESLDLEHEAPHSAQATFELARAYRALDQQKNAIFILMKLTEVATTADILDEATLLLAECQVDIELYVDARETLRAFLRRFPDSPLRNDAKIMLSKVNLKH